MQVVIEHAPDDLPAGPNEGFAMTHLLAARVAAEEAERCVGVAKPDDGLQRITFECLVDRQIDAFGVRSQLT